MANRSSGAKLQWDEDKFRESLLAVSSFFKVKELYDNQVTILRNFFKGNDVYFSAPTGFGKSLIFQAMPIIADQLFDRSFGTSILVIISPLVALMTGQVYYLNTKVGLTAAAIQQGTDELCMQSIENGEVSYVYSSPESMLSLERWRKILTSNIYKEACIGIVVDEAHCISEW